MKIVALIIVMQLVVTLITGCADYFPIAAKMEEMRSEQLTCSAEDESLCAGWKM